MSDTIVRARIDSKTKEKAAAALDAMGLSISDAIRLLLLRVADKSGFLLRLRYRMRRPRRRLMNWNAGGVSDSTARQNCSTT